MDLTSNTDRCKLDHQKEATLSKYANEVGRKGFKVDELRAITGFGERAIRDAIKDGKLKVVRAGRKIIVPAFAVDEWLKTAARDLRQERIPAYADWQEVIRRDYPLPQDEQSAIEFWVSMGMRFYDMLLDYSLDGDKNPMLTDPELIALHKHAALAKTPFEFQEGGNDE